MSTKMISREHNQKDFRIYILLQFTLFSTRILPLLLISVKAHTLIMYINALNFVHLSAVSLH